MNKLLTMFTCAGVAFATQAAQLDWSYTATSSDVGQTVYVMLGAEAVQEWENLDAVKSASVSNGEVVKIGRTSYGTDGSFSSDKITKDSANVYYVVVSADGETFGVTSVSDMTGSVYDPAAQESSPGQNTSLSSDSIAKSGIFYIVIKCNMLWQWT